ncbi:hypothetical protein [Nonomuraea sp. NPDC049141]|uniref:hypothetical protein n=1 Tax=unclassified Nonomuraea TaxID=2593643 RepID=UPI0033C9F9D1
MSDPAPEDHQEHDERYGDHDRCRGDEVSSTLPVPPPEEEPQADNSGTVTAGLRVARRLKGRGLLDFIASPRAQEPERSGSGGDVLRLPAVCARHVRRYLREYAWFNNAVNGNVAKSGN